MWEADPEFICRLCILVCGITCSCFTKGLGDLLSGISNLRRVKYSFLESWVSWRGAGKLRWDLDWPEQAFPSLEEKPHVFNKAPDWCETGTGLGVHHSHKHTSFNLQAHLKHLMAAWKSFLACYDSGCWCSFLAALQTRRLLSVLRATEAPLPFCCAQMQKRVQSCQKSDGKRGREENERRKP